MTASSTPSPAADRRRAWRSLPAGVWTMGLASLCMDTSSEMIHSLLPIFTVSVLGASMITVGLIEGLAEATASFMKVVSGAMSDRLGRRKPLMVAGYALAALTKPFFPLAPTVGWVFAARCGDRLGKGIRGAPRDALVAELTPADLRGAAYGLRQALDSAGAFMGPLLAAGLMVLLAHDIRAVMGWAVLPALAAVGLLLRGVREPRRTEAPKAPRQAITLLGLRTLPAGFWGVVALGTVMTLARFSEAFLVLRARDVGLPLAQVPLVMVAMNVCYAAAAYPAGAATDRLRPRTMLWWGMALLISADLALALGGTPFTVFLGAALWGIHMGLTQGLLSKLVADRAPDGLLGTAFGVFHLVTGLAVLSASVLAGWLWASLGPRATFLAGAGFAAIASLGLFVPRHPPRVRPSI